jgi:predicted dehydrogenase
VLWDLAVHDLSILSRLRSLDGVVSLHAHGSKYFGEHIEIGHLHLDFADGFAAHIHVSWLSPVKIRHTFLGGTKAMITYNDTEPSEKIRIYNKGVEHAGAKTDPFFPMYRSGDVMIPALDNTETLLRETRHVIACLRGDAHPYAGGNEGLQFVRILEKADESLRLRQPVSLSS